MPRCQAPCPKNQKNNMKQAFAAVILLFVVFLMVVYLVVPKYARLKNVKEEVVREELALQQQQAYLANLQKITEGLETHSETLERIESALPREFSLPALLSFFQQKVAENGLVL